MRIKHQYNLCIVTTNTKYAKLVHDIISLIFPIRNYVVVDSIVHVEEYRYDIVIFDQKSQPDIELIGIRVTGRNEKWLAVNVESNDSLTYIFRGFHGHLTEPCLESLPRAINAIWNGEFWFPRQVVRDAMSQFDDRVQHLINNSLYLSEIKAVQS